MDKMNRCINNFSIIYTDEGAIIMEKRKMGKRLLTKKELEKVNGGSCCNEPLLVSGISGTSNTILADRDYVNHISVYAGGIQHTSLNAGETRESLFLHRNL